MDMYISILSLCYTAKSFFGQNHNGNNPHFIFFFFCCWHSAHNTTSTYVAFKLKLTRFLKNLMFHLFKGIKIQTKMKRKLNNATDSVVVFLPHFSVNSSFVHILCIYIVLLFVVFCFSFVRICFL